MLLLLAFALGSVAQTFPDCLNGPLKNNTVCNPNASTAARASALVSALTTAEKLALTGSTSPGAPRLGLPPYQWWQEALHGVASSPGVLFAASGNYSFATSFPEPILMSAAFDDPLIHDVATIISTEARSFSNANRTGLDFFTPNINPYRDPRWGRGMETPGEDAFHISSYVRSLITGLQGGENPAIKKVVATCKHVAAYDLENWNGNLRYEFDAIVNPQDLAEYFLPSFRACTRDANAGAVMCSYNALNGVPTCANSYLLQDILRDHWNWEAEDHYVTSDCDAIQDIFTFHHYTNNATQAVADAINAGDDLDCGTYYPINLPAALNEGLFNVSTLNQAINRLYSALINVGYFDPPSATPYRALNFGDVSTPAAQQLALRAAEESMVLLKNDGVLPIDLSGLSIALIGSWANATTQMQGNYFGVAPYLHSPLFAAQQLENVTINFASGASGPTDPTTQTLLNALNAANTSDIIIYVDGIDTSVEAEGMDRVNISWFADQTELISTLSSLGKPMIIAQMGDQVDNSAYLTDSNINAIIWGGYPGQDGGTALINIITGKTAPAGRLPVTQYPADYVNQVPMTDMSLRPNSTPGFENPGRTYRWYNESVVDFGFGLHYTNFSISSPRLATPKLSNSTSSRFAISDIVSNCNSSTPLDLCPFSTLQATITNTGSTTSDFVALAFISGEFGPPPFPIKTLVAYERLFNITGGASSTANLALTLGSLARVDETGSSVIFPGSYSVLLDVPTQSVFGFELVGMEAVIDKFPQNSG